MGGDRRGVARDAARTVLVCISNPGLAGELSLALAEVGFRVEVVDTVDELARRGDDAETAVVIVDDSVSTWLRATIDLVRRRPEVRPVVLADIDNPDEFLAALTGGVAGFCRSGASVDAIVRTIQSVQISGVAIPRDLVVPLVAQVRHGRGHRMNTAAGPIDVTHREWEIMQLMLQRRSTREIADALYVSVGTVRSHVSALMHKVGAVDRDDLITMVERAGPR
ncbi:MAG TPA: response regulator transcription factor [Ilumatobacter sp.]